MLPKINNELNNPKIKGAKRKRIETDASLIRAMVSQDFLRCNPAIVAIDTMRDYTVFGHTTRIEYIPFFEKNRLFKKLWKQYHYKQLANNFVIFVRK